MKTEELDYTLPERLIAQHPCEQRDQSRLLVLDRATGTMLIDVYAHVARYLRAGDCMVLNDTRVIRARLHGYKHSGGRVEVFLIQEIAEATWSALVRPAAKVKPGTRITLPSGMEVEVGERLPEGKRLVRFDVPDVLRLLEKNGEIPLPPYIHRSGEDTQDADRYQTIYARTPGAVAAPTAGLHLTPEVIASLEKAGVNRIFLTLHVGYGTFKPVTALDLESHSVDPEEYDLPEETAQMLNSTREAGGRILAVGTTCTRVLETRYDRGQYHAGHGVTRLYIYPPYEFRGVDMLQTNFHLPKSSLLALVCAFAGKELVMEAYRLAVREEFRFYSYGDVMLIR